MIVFGGNNCFATFYSDVWVLANANGVGTPAWTLLAPTGVPPAARWGAPAVYDPASNRMIVFGGVVTGTESNEVWVLTNANGLGGTPTWIQLAPAGALPALRGNHVAVYDALSNRMTVFGGSGGGVGFNDVWVLSNANGMGGTPAWTELAPSGTAPTAKTAASAVYDPGTNRMIIFGGSDPSMGNDVWVLTRANGQ